MSYAPAHLVESLDAGIGHAQREQALMLTAADVPYSGRTVHLLGTELRNFISCSYLGLELREDIQQGAIDAIRRFGSQFSCSRAMLQLPLYEELTAALQEITGGYPVVSGSTSLAHIAALPVLVGERDAVLVDVAAHASLHTALALLHGVHVEPVRHNRVDLLDSRVRALSATHRRVWYVLDGLYSILGQFAPIDELAALMERHPALHLYVDDAHSTSWTGLHGRGHALDRLQDRERVVGVLSLNKAFSAGGGALVFPEKQTADRVLRAGGPMVFSGPLQPPLLGAAVASAKVHLSPVLPELQARLRSKFGLLLSLSHELGVPLEDESPSPIWFLRCGTPERTFELVKRMRTKGFCVTPAVYPIVPRQQAGIRFCVTLHNSDEDIRALLTAFAGELSLMNVTSRSRTMEAVAVPSGPEAERKLA